jgi:hypothetical protein
MLPTPTGNGIFSYCPSCFQIRFATAIRLRSKTKPWAHSMSRCAHLRCGVDLISDALLFGKLWYEQAPDAIEYAKHRSRSHAAVIRVYDEAGNMIANARASISSKSRIERTFPNQYFNAC